jgi:DNA-binding MarR family transcriptional regulator
MASEPEMTTDPGETSLVEVSTSRVRVLKALKDDRQTVSELAREIDLNKSTVHGYLQDLIDDGFVRRHEDDDRLWVYYSLSPVGRKLVARDQLRLVVDLGSIAAFLASAAIGVHELFFASQDPTGGGGTLATPSGGSAGTPWTAIAYVSLLALTLLGVGLHVYLRRTAIGDAEPA